MTTKRLVLAVCLSAFLAAGCARNRCCSSSYAPPPPPVVNYAPPPCP